MCKCTREGVYLVTSRDSRRRMAGVSWFLADTMCLVLTPLVLEITR
jgi:hypothetical protein